MTFFEIYIIVANTVIPVGIWVTLLWLWKCRVDDGKESRRLKEILQNREHCAVAGESGHGYAPEINEDFSAEARGICVVCEELGHGPGVPCPGPTYRDVPKKREGYFPDMDEEIKNSG